MYLGVPTVVIYDVYNPCVCVIVCIVIQQNSR